MDDNQTVEQWWKEARLLAEQIHAREGNPKPDPESDVLRKRYSRLIASIAELTPTVQ